jgi:RNA polymerase sigma-70 factor (ECF subfamily)
MPGEAASFEEIVERYHGKVFALAYRYTGDYDAACDLTQDTFVRAFGAWGEFRGDAQVFTWLYRIALNLCHNHQKKHRRRSTTELQLVDAPREDGEGEAFPLPDSRPLPAQISESAEMRQKLQDALRDLPENYRTVVVLRDIEGLSYEEIARITDSSLEAIKSRLFRARNTIRRLLEPYMNEPLSPLDAPQFETGTRRPRMKRS